VTYAIIKTGSDLSKLVVNLYNINFDIAKLIKINFDPFFININPVFFLTVFTIIVSITMIVIAKRLSKDKEKLPLAYIYYTLIYAPLFALWWVVSIYYKIFNKKVFWGKRWV